MPESTVQSSRVYIAVAEPVMRNARVYTAE